MKSDGTKISKSLGNGYTLEDLEQRGFSAMDFRMLILQGQYSNEGNFTFDNLAAARNRLHRWKNMAALRHQTHDTLHDDDKKSAGDDSISLLATSGAMLEALNHDLNTPEALRIVDHAFGQLDGTSLKRIHQFGLGPLIETIDELLGLQLAAATPDITDEQKRKLLERLRAREDKDWATADRIRDELKADGLVTRDTSTGQIWEYS